MSKMRHIAMVIMVTGVLYAGFWGVAKHQYTCTAAYRLGELTKDQFVQQLPVLYFACRFFDFDPFGKPVPYRSISPGWIVGTGVIRHIWIGLMFFFLGCSIRSFGGNNRLRVVMHYIFVVLFGGALFVAAMMHPIIIFWHGK